MNTVRDEWKMECPKCHSDEAIQIEIMVWCDLMPDGTDIDAQDHEWNNDNKAVCGCGFEGKVKDFVMIWDKKDWTNKNAAEKLTGCIGGQATIVEHVLEALELAQGFIESAIPPHRADRDQTWLMDTIRAALAAAKEAK